MQPRILACGKELVNNFFAICFVPLPLDLSRFWDASLAAESMSVAAFRQAIARCGAKAVMSPDPQVEVSSWQYEEARGGTGVEAEGSSPV